MLHGLAVPRWLAIEFVRRCELVIGACVGSWDEAFGRPWPARTRLPQVRRRRALQKRVHQAVFSLAIAEPTAALWRDDVFQRVGDQIGKSGSTVERIYYQALRDGLPSVATMRAESQTLSLSARST